MNAKLDKWAELLLDTGKRNNLINFKNRYTSVAEVVYPSSTELFSKVLADECFDPVALGEGEKSFPYDGMEDDELKNWYRETYQFKVRKSADVLLYCGEQKILNTLKNIVKKTKLALEETGVNIAYLAFGFIHWFEEGSEEQLVAPILLVPVVFESRGANRLPKIDVLENEIILNPSFAYKCQREFGLTLPEYENQPFIDYLNLIELVILSQGWFVSDECKLSTFSFLKINMYRDIEDNRDMVLQNENVKILLGDAPATLAFSEEARCELHSIVDADSSQEDAIRSVKNGKSIVLQGPPGTGKSQTITNIIAECLLDGKKVLFVSEKLAALNVVYEKLKKEGLSEFCLELHSHKANKKDFLNDICSVLKSEKQKISERVEKEILEKSVCEDGLEEYKKQLHLKREKLQMSVYELINGYYMLSKSTPLLYDVKNVKQISGDDLELRISLLNEYQTYAETFGRKYYEFCYYGYVDGDSSHTKINSTYEKINRLTTHFSKALELKNRIYNQFGLEIKSVTDLMKMGSFLNFLGGSKVMTPKLLLSPNSTLLLVTQAENYAKRINLLESQLLSVFKPEFLTVKLDLPSDLLRLKSEASSLVSRLTSKYYKNILNKFTPYLIKEGNFTNVDLIYYIEKTNVYYNLLEIYKAYDEALLALLGEEYVGKDSRWWKIKQDIGVYCSMNVCASIIEKFSSFERDEFIGKRAFFASFGSDIGALMREMEGLLQSFDNLFDAQICSFRSIGIIEGIEKLQMLYTNAHKLSEWITFNKLLEKIKENELIYYLNAYVDSAHSLKDIEEVYRRETYRTLAQVCIMENPVMASFSKVTQDKMVERFIDKDKISLEANKAKIKAFLASKRPDLERVTPGSEVSMILHEGAKKRMQKSVRRLLLEAGECIQNIKPCFLMSPLSVSTFLASGKVNFDVVVFDEASQIFPQDAIGSIYRGKQLVVVGDSKQMPPSNFFLNTVTGAIEEEGAEDEISDYESILDICSACFAQKYLRWHYRSKHESLIAFSNSKFYDNKLITFPSTKKQQEGLGVDYYYVDGKYEQNQRINKKEAERVADLVFEHFDNEPGKSLGVVAFNMSQQNYIEKVITLRREANPKYEKFFKEDNKEPFFIKNLETVQGDERDVIIFSVAYGYNSSGKFIHNFGPLNHKGGERRLNVAVTRAKENVKLVASISANDISLEKTQAEGARLLKEYLSYAQYGVLETGSVTSEGELDGFESEVASFISSKGYLFEKKVGVSSAKIDIGIKNETGEEFVLAVECDGRSYASYQTVRDRDRIRRGVLENSGWKYYRVWSLDWFNNRPMAKYKLLKAIASSVKGAKITDEEVQDQMKDYLTEFDQSYLKDLVEDFQDGELNDWELPDVDEITSSNDETPLWHEPLDLDKTTVNYGFSTYLTANLNALYEMHGSNFQNFVKEVLKVESPINERWFLKRIVKFLGHTIITSDVISDYNIRMAGCEYKGIIRRDGFLYLEGKADFNLRLPSSTCRREIDLIAIEELANGLLKIITYSGKIEKLALYNLLAQKLKIIKLTSVSRVRLDKALTLLVADITVEGAYICRK